jgi:uncharacterized protein
MTLHVVPLKDIGPQRWRNGGGVTYPLLCWPGVDDWTVRVSVADIEQEGPFSEFHNVERYIAALTGNGILLGEPINARLQPGSPPLAWPGHVAPECKLIDGPTRDLNVMFDIRYGEGFLRMLHAQDSDTDRGVVLIAKDVTKPAIRGIFVLHDATARSREEVVAMPAMSLLWSDDDHSDWHLQCSSGAWYFQYTLRAEVSP